MGLIRELKEVHESRLKYRRDMYAHGEYMKDEGIQMAKEEIVSRMLMMHMDISVIEKVTELSEERIKEIEEKENMV